MVMEQRSKTGFALELPRLVDGLDWRWPVKRQAEGFWGGQWIGFLFLLPFVVMFVVHDFASVMLMAVAAGAGAIVEVAVALSGASEERQWQFYRWWLRFAAVIVLCLNVWGFQRLHT